jgi:hypothetical protein
MITNTGKNILAKYLVGQAPAYASYIAVGCGATPLPSDGVLGDYSSKANLDFEMFRVPITSRGYVNENGINKIVLTAELPTEERYEISEIGIYSAGSNPAVGSYDSKSVYSFVPTENWEHHTLSAATEIPIVYGPLDGSNNDNIIDQPYSVFQTNADNRIFTSQERVSRYERSRFLNNTILMRGDTSDLDMTIDNHISINPNSEHIHITGISLDFNKNTPTDELKLAFSIVNADGSSTATPDKVRILVDFTSSDISGSGDYARFEVDLENLVGSPAPDFENNRYFVVTKQLQELYKSSGFTWNAVNVVKIYSCVINNDEPSADFYVALDAIRLENTNSANPLYGLTGYSVIKNTNAETIIKSPNTTNYLEFRFGLAVQ